MRFPVVNQCRFCYNTIYNSAPLFLGLPNRSQGLTEGGPPELYGGGTSCGGRDPDAFFEEYGMSEKAAEPPVLRNQFTRGHFKRGVE